MTNSVNEKKISVIVPNYNYSRYLERRVKSILSQTYQIFELIILDDASIDDSEITIKNIEKSLKKRNINIKTIINEENSGNVFRQWQRGFEAATGEYVWIAEADDIADKSFLENVMKGFDDCETILSYSKSKMIDEKGRISIKRAISQELIHFKRRHWKSDYINDGKKEIQEVLCVYNTIPNVSAVVFKKDKTIDFSNLLEKAQKFQIAGDWYFYCELLLHGKIAYCKKALNKQRIHLTSVTKTIPKEKYLAEVKETHELISGMVLLDKKSKKAMQEHEEYLASRFHL